MAQLRGWYEKMCTVHTVVEDVGIVIRVVVMMKGIAASISNVNGGGECESGRLLVWQRQHVRPAKVVLTRRRTAIIFICM